MSSAAPQDAVRGLARGRLLVDWRYHGRLWNVVWEGRAGVAMCRACAFNAQ